MKIVVTLLILFFLTFLSYGKTLQMYYWVDDWAMAYKVLYPEEAPGNMGKGVFGNGGPYRYLVTPFIALYPIFGFNAFPYFAIGAFLYFLAAFSVYLLTKELTQKHCLALSAAGIFAAGFIGAHALYRLTNSYQTVGGTLFICLTVWLFAKFLRTRKIRFYWLSFILFTISIEIFFIRTHGLFLSLLGVSKYYIFNEIYKGSIKNLVIKLVPFGFVFYYMYFIDPRILVDSKLVLSGMEGIFKNGEVALFNNLFVNFGNIFIPDQITANIYQLFLTFSAKQVVFKPEIFSLLLLAGVFILGMLKKAKNNKLLLSFPIATAIYCGFVLWSGNQSSSLWTPRGIELFTSLLGFSLLVSFLFISFINYKNHQIESFLIPLSIYWIFVNSVTLFIYSPWTNLESTSRYFVPSFAGVGILYAATFALLLKRKLMIFSIAAVIIILLYFSNKEADTMIKNISRPDKQGYNLILSEVKKVDKNTIFYIDTEDEPKFKNAYLGRLPQLGISALFNYHGITSFADSYDNLFSLLKDQKTNLSQLQTYFFGTDGYKSTTLRMRKLLEFGGDYLNLNAWNNFNAQTLVSQEENMTLGINPSLEIEINYDSLVPVVLEFTMALLPLNLSNINFPYYDVTDKHLPARIDNLQILSTLKEESRIQNFRNQASVKATSSWKGTEELYLIDGREDTNWGADNNQWSSIPKPQGLIIDLGYITNVSRLVRINHHYMATPTVYSIFSSNDGVNWILILNVKNKQRQEGGVVIEDKFPQPVNARFLKMNILQTYGGPGYPPAIKELWVSNLQENIDPGLSKKVVKCPFCYVSDYVIAKEIIQLINSIATAKVWWETDRRLGFHEMYSKQFPVILDGQPHLYKILLPANGTKFKKLKIDSFQIPVTVSLDNASMRSLSLDEIYKDDLGSYAH